MDGQTELGTFLFADLRDYTAFVEGEGDRAAARLIASYRALIRERLPAFSGAEVKTEGDSFYIVFRSPSQAIGFGADVLEAARAATGGERAGLRFGVGIHAGETVPLEGQFVGSAVNVAARVGALAGEGELLITDTVRGLVRTSCPFPMRERGPVELKGVPEPVSLYAVEWRTVEDEPLAIAPSPPVAVGTPLVGRTEEMARLVALSAAIERRESGVVLIGGPAGIGKTRLVREWAARAGDQLTLVGSCGSLGGRVYGPFVEMLRGLARTPGAEARLRRVAPELLVLLPDLAPLERPRQLDRETLFGAFLRLVRDIAAGASVALVAEDLHWADEGTLALFRFLAREARDSRFALAGTYRDDELVRGHPLRALVAEASRWPDTTTLSLHPLAAAEAELLLQRANASSLAAGERERVIALAEGNPLFLEELARSSGEHGGRLPLSIAESVLRRVGALDDASRRTVSYAAVAGPRVEVDLLQRLLDLPERDVLRALRAAVEAAILVETADGIEFTHALTREAVSRDLMKREERLLHREIAEALVALHGDDAGWAAEIERHFLDGGAPDRAAPYALAAGNHALALLAPHVAVAHFERAVDAARAPLDRARALDGLGTAYRLELQVGKAVATLRDAVALFAEHGTPRDLATAQASLAKALPFGREERAAWQLAWDRAIAAKASAAELARIAQTLAGRAWEYMEDDVAARWLGLAREHAAAAGAESLAASVEDTARPIEHLPGWHVAEERDLAHKLDRALERDIGVVLAYRRYIDARCREADAEERAALTQRARAYADERVPGIASGMVFRYGAPWLAWCEGEWDRVLGLWDALGARFSGDDVAEIYPDTGPLAAAIRLEREGPEAAGPEMRRLVARQERSDTWRAHVAGASHLANLELAEGHASGSAAAAGALHARRTPQALAISSFVLASRAVAAAALVAKDEACTAPWRDAAPLLGAQGRLFELCLARIEGVALAVEGDEAGGARAIAGAEDGFRDLGWQHLAAECGWQRARLGDRAGLSASRAFYEARGATWRVRWIDEEGWR